MPELPPDDTQPQPPILPPEMPDDEATRIQGKESRTRGMPPVEPVRRTIPPPPVNVRRATPPPPPPTQIIVPEKPKRASLYAPTPRPARRENPLRLPLWSVFIMLTMVCGAVSCIVVAVVGLGGRTPAASPPRFVIVTAEMATSTAFVLDSIAPTPYPNQIGSSGEVPAFSLQGPTLPPVIISPTPESMGIGKTVMVEADESGLNVRAGAGIQNQRLFVADDGEVFTIVGGPTQADGFTWWEIQSPNDPTRRGWGASVFLAMPTAEAVPIS